MTDSIASKIARITRTVDFAAVSFLALLSMSSPAFAANEIATQAVSTDAIIDSFGINTHMMNQWFGNSYTWVAGAEAELRYLGFRYARDCFCDRYGDAAMRQVHNDIGVKYNIWISGSHYDYSMSELRANRDMVVSVEGANEADNFSQTFGNLSGMPAAVAEQKQLFTDIKADPNLAGVDVNSMTLMRYQNETQLGDSGNYSDYSSSHIYPQWGGSIGETAFGYTQFLTGKFQPMAPNRQSIITEGGWWTLPGPRGVTEIVHAKYTLNMLLDSFKQGVKRLYLYELMDEYYDPTGTDMERHFGMFRFDYSAKPAAIAIHNLTTLLGDAGTNAAPGTLSYSLNGLPATSQQLLAQKSDGTFVLAVWNDAPIWDNINLRERPVADAQIMLNLGTQANVDIYDPMVGTSPTVSKSAISGFTLALPDHPILLFIKPIQVQAPVVAAAPVVAPTPVAGISQAPVSAPAPAPAPATVVSPVTVLTMAHPVNTIGKGGWFNISYKWQARAMNKNYRAFVRFIDSNGNTVAQDDYAPTPTTTKWSGVVTVTHRFTAPRTLPAGSYRIVTGLYDTGAGFTGLALTQGAGVSEVGAHTYQIGTMNLLN